MTLSFDSKEDLRLQMADLERKLAESEEERHKLEKTCDVLMRAFREEEKVRYKALNTNYEKFLQDCTVRKRRNDIILRSLCRIEDRSRALFAKTERLKLLKDRYISYLKISDYKDGTSAHIWKPLSISSQRLKTANEGTPKSVQWKTPLSTDDKMENLKDEKEKSTRYDKSSEVPSHNSRVSYTSPEKYNEEERTELREYENEKNNEFDGTSCAKTVTKSSDAQNKFYSVETRLDLPVSNNISSSFNGGEPTEVIKKKSDNFGVFKNETGNELEVKDLVEVGTTRERNNVGHQESVEKLKKSLSFGDEFPGHENIEGSHNSYDKKMIKDDTEHSEKKQNNSHDVQLARIDLLTGSNSNIYQEGKEYKHAGEVGMELKTGSSEESVSDHVLPMGLDGVDYQNETYPESYYEQPVHQNHTSIVADVILEEDETEQDVGDEEKDFSGYIQSPLLSKGNSNSHKLGSWEESPGHRTYDKLTNLRSQQNWKNITNDEISLTDKVHDPNEKAIGEFRSPKSESENLRETNLSDFEDKEVKGQGVPAENLERKKNVRSNLIHFLESDSESFQIEHGDSISGNDDSDFDFSFH